MPPTSLQRSLCPAGRTRVWPTALLLLAGLLASPALAGDGDFDHPTLNRFAVTLGSFFSTIDTDLRVDSRVDLNLGDRFDFENAVGLEDSDTLFRLALEWRFKPRHQLNFGYYSLSRSNTQVLTREVEFGDVTFPVNIEAEGFFKNEIFEISYTWWVLLKEKLAFGISAGGVSIVRIDARLTAADINLGVLNENVGTDLPVPLFGVSLRYALPHKFVFRSELRLITGVTVDDVKGEVFDLTAALEHRTFEHFGFGVALNAIEFNVETTKPRLRGEVEYGIEGVQVYARVAF